MDEQTNNAAIVPFEAIMHGDYKLLSIEKIRTEMENFNGDAMSKSISDSVAAKLTDFCNENELVAEVVYRTKRTISDCCDYIFEKVKEKRTAEKNSSVVALSDVEVYGLMLGFYFPDSKVEAKMSLSLGKIPSQEEMDRIIEKKKPEPKIKKSEKAKKKEESQQTAFEEFDAPAAVKKNENDEESEYLRVIKKTPVKCKTCGKELTDSMVSWSLKHYGGYYCKACQELKSKESSDDSFIQLSLI